MSKILALCGSPRTGKDTIAAHLVANHNFERIAFADPLREALLALDPWVCTTADFCCPEAGDFVSLRDLVNTDGWDYAKQYVDVRDYLQSMGTEAGRDIHGKECWLKIAQQKIHKAFGQGKRVVITDMRFQNEVAFMDRRLDTFKLHVSRPGYGKVNEHSSEQLDYEVISDGTIINNGAVEDLCALVDQLLLDLGW